MSDAAMERPPQAARPVPFRGGGFSPKPLGLIGPIVFAIIIAFWEFGSRMGFISALVLPAPSEAFEAFRQLIESGLLWKHLGASLSRLIGGWVSAPNSFTAGNSSLI